MILLKASTFSIRTPIIPVSYTHLDVYKRQSLLRTRTNSNLTEFLEEDNLKRPALASRSASDLKLNRLQKRQMSVQELSLDDAVKQKQRIMEEVNVTRSVLVNGKPVAFSRTHTNSFQRVGKRKLGISKEDSSLSISNDHIHVMATPAKALSDVNSTSVLVESPMIISETPSKSNQTIKQDAKPEPKRVRRRLFAP